MNDFHAAESSELIELRSTPNCASITILTLVMMVCLASGAGAVDKPDSQLKPATAHRAASMEGQWGVRFVMPGMKHPDALADFDVKAMVDQLKLLDTVSWVQINVTQAANSSFYVSPHKTLAKHISPKMVPERDLFGEMMDALLAAEFKVHVYFASEGPGRNKHVDRHLPGAIDKWETYIASKNMTHKEAVAEIIVKEYSKRYGTKISGWWFDHTRNADIPLLAKAARAGNPNVLLTFNVGASTKLRTCPEADFTSGHPMPLKVHPANWKGNEEAIELIEKHKYVNGALSHIFPPMQSNWTFGKPVFKTEQAIDWTMRVINAGGAITWAVALADTKKQDAPLAEVQFNQLIAINKAVAGSRAKK